MMPTELILLSFIPHYKYNIPIKSRNVHKQLPVQPRQQAEIAAPGFSFRAGRRCYFSDGLQPTGHHPNPTKPHGSFHP